MTGAQNLGGVRRRVESFEGDLRGRTRDELVPVLDWLIPNEQVTSRERSDFEWLGRRRRVRWVDSLNVARIVQCQGRKPSQVKWVRSHSGTGATCCFAILGIEGRKKAR